MGVVWIMVKFDHGKPTIAEALSIRSDKEVQDEIDSAYSKAKMRSEVLEKIYEKLESSQIEPAEAIYFAFRFGQKDAGYQKALDENATPTAGKNRWESLEMVVKKETENDRGLPKKSKKGSSSGEK